MVAIINRYISRRTLTARYHSYFGSSLHNRGYFMVFSSYRRCCGSSSHYLKVAPHISLHTSGRSTSLKVSDLSLCSSVRYGGVYRSINYSEPLLHFADNCHYSRLSGP